MGDTIVDVANVGLGLLGVDPITTFDDPCRAADLLKRQWDMMVRATLEAKDWSFAMDRRELAADPTPPVFGYTARYLLPSDVLRVVEVVPADATSSLHTMAVAESPYGSASKVDWEKEGRYILAVSDAPTIYIRGVCFTDVAQDPANWSPGFELALAARVAADLAIPITQDRSIMASMEALFEARTAKAGANDGRGAGRTQTMRSDYLAARRRG